MPKRSMSLPPRIHLRLSHPVACDVPPSPLLRFPLPRVLVHTCVPTYVMRGSASDCVMARADGMEEGAYGPMVKDGARSTRV